MYIMFAMLSEGLAEPGDSTLSTVQGTQQGINSMNMGVKVHNCSVGKIRRE